MGPARGMPVLAAVGSLALVGLGLVACDGDAGQPEPTRTAVRVGLAYDTGGPGDTPINDLAAAGLDLAEETYDIETRVLPAPPDEPQAEKYARLMSLCEGGYNPVIAVGFGYATALGRAAADCSATTFAIVDTTVTAPNVTSLVFAEEQGSFLIGAAAALKSRTGHVGFVGGCLIPLIQKFEAGYVAGARTVNAAIRVDVTYLSTPQQACAGFDDPGQAKIAAAGMYDSGADIVFQAARGSGTGVFQAAVERGLRAIGAESDAYETADPALRHVIITSLVKRVDVAVFRLIKAYVDGSVEPGVETYDLEHDGVGCSTAGGFIDDISDQLDDYRTRIISGEIAVPSSPE